MPTVSPWVYDSFDLPGTLEVRKNRPTRRSRINPFARLFGGGSSALSRAPRRREIERLEARQVLSATVASNPYFEDQWHLDATGQQTEFDPTSPTRDQTLAEIDINVTEVWDQLITGLGTQVGIISGGFDLTHEDLAANFITTLGYNALGSTFNPDGSVATINTDTAFVDPTDGTGTSVAGLIGAANNDLGVVGIAYEADLVPIQAIPTGGVDSGDDARATALRWRVGFVLDRDGDGILTAADGVVDNDGDGALDGLAANEVIDVYFVSGELAGAETTFGTANELGDSVLAAIEDGANNGRARWDDLDGDGLFDLDEVSSLGAIYVVPSGNDNGTGFNIPFENTGFDASSQYNELANSRYTIAVGAVDYDGRYENNATGLVTSFSEMGANVLLVAPSSTTSINQAGDTNLNSGVLTTDITDEGGSNALPDPFFGELDLPGPDFFQDPNYTSTFGGTEAAAAQVTAVVAQMLEVNPNLSRRDVEQILLQSARTIDQFDESWVVNPYNYFQYAGADGAYIPPAWIYYGIDVADDMGVFDGDANIEFAAVPNGPFVNQDGILDIVDLADGNVYDPGLIRSYFAATITGIDENGNFFASGPDLTVPTFAFGLVDATGQVVPTGASLGVVPNDPFFILSNIPDTGQQWGVRDLISPTNLEEVPLQFTNGVGYTVSQGRGRYLEEYGYAHGLLDAELAVELAQAWSVNDAIAGDTGLFKAREVSISSPILDGGGSLLNIQGRADIGTGRGDEEFLIPGGINGVALATDRYSQWTVPVSGDDITRNDNKIGEVITNGPFWDPEGTLSFSPQTDAGGAIKIPIDQSVDFDFLSIESIEVRGGIQSGDIDHLRISVLAPDGTQTELNPYSLPAEDDDIYSIQRPQFGQGSGVPNYYETLNELSGGFPSINFPVGGPGINGGDNGFDNGSFTDFNDGSDNKLFVERERQDALPAGQAWTWTTNRHYGELFSVEAATNTFDPFAGFSVSGTSNRDTDGWYLVFENWGGAVDMFGLQFTINGTEATGQRIQGKIGVDDNAQNIDFFNTPLDPVAPLPTNPTPEQLGDGVFNFNRFIEFGEVVADPTPNFSINPGGTPHDTDPRLDSFLLLSGDETVYTVVVDDPTDAVDLSDLPGRAYRTIDPDTGIERVFPVVSKTAYMSGDPTELASELDEFDTALLGEFGTTFGSQYITTSLRRTDGTIGHTQSAPRSFDGSTAVVRVDGTPGTVQNFDYSQESFAAGETVLAQQFRVNYDSAGNPGARIATGQTQRFITGADGNYYFDVESNPAPPNPATDPFGYENWFEDFGFTLEYDVSVVDDAGRAWDRAYLPDAQEDPLSQVSYQGDAKYTVQLFDATDVLVGQTTTVQEVNFLLGVDLAEVQLSYTGTVVRDIDGDAVRDGTDGTYAGITVYYDANNNTVFDADEISAVSAADGTFELMFDPAENESVTLRLDPTTYPAADPLREIVSELTFTNFDPGDSITGDFFLKPTASIVTGTIWQDTDQDGLFDPEETPVDGTLLGRNGTTPALFVYQDSTTAGTQGVFDMGIDVAATVSATGAYQLEFTTPDTYVIRLDLTNSDVSQTFPSGDGPRTVVVAAEEVLAGENFGVKDLRVFDYGDLPDSYGTTLTSAGYAQGGARHRNDDPNVYLGTAAPDLELNGQPTPNADGDDNDGLDDESGVTLLSDEIVAGGTVQFRFLANGGGANLNAWVDWNNDGDFDVDEQIFTDLDDIGTGVFTFRTADVPVGIATADRYAARFRWGTAAVGPTGPSQFGEVEDLWLTPNPAIIRGRVLQDVDNDGQFNDGVDTPIQGVRVFIDENLNGIREIDEPAAVSGADGRYEFEVLVTATDTPVTIRAEQTTLPAGTAYLDPTDGIIADLADPGEIIDAEFLLSVFPRPEQVITGTVVRDADSNPGLSGSEDGIEGAIVQLLTNTDADPELEVIASTTTNANGAYQFAVADTGVYEVRVDLPAITTLLLTTPAAGVTLTVDTGETVPAPTFGIFDRRDTFTRDYGDLRVGGGDDYPTTEAQGGASHLVVSGVFLGSTVDADEGILSSGNATADDLDGVDDEDGVVLLTPQIVPGGPIVFDVTATGTAGSVLNAWVDFDDNGTFDADEQIAVDLALVNGETSKLTRTTNADTSTTATFLNTRFRWGTPGVGPDGSTGAGGVDAVGEVEDHRIPVLKSPTGVVGDFDLSGLVTTSDYDFWAATFGASVPAGTGADGNGNGRIDVGDFTIWRDAFELGASNPSSATSAPVSGPVIDAGETAELVVDTFAPLTATSPTAALALDESLAIDADSSSDNGAIEAALLEWSLDDQADAEGDSVEALNGSDDEANETEETDLAFEDAFAF